MQGGGAPLQFLIGEGSHLLGRDNHCSVQVLSDSVSGEHARLILSPQGIFIEDLASTSGTYIDGIRIVGKVEVTAKQVIHVSDCCEKECPSAFCLFCKHEKTFHLFDEIIITHKTIFAFSPSLIALTSFRVSFPL